MALRACLAAALAALAMAALSGHRPAHAVSARAASSGESLALSARLDGLMVGETAPLRIEVTNRTSRPLVAGRIRVGASAAGPGCEAANLRIASYDGRLRLRPGQTAVVRTPATLAPAAPDACQGATFALRLRASVRR